jgi:DNA-binding SARP family transcriptional activator
VAPRVTSAAGVRIQLLGGLRLETADGGHVPSPTGRARSLFIYLLLHPQAAHSRERLAEVLWSEEVPERAARNLTEAAYRLRHALPGLVEADRGTLRLVAAAATWVDVWEFETWMRAATRDDLRQAVALYRGELAPEVYDDWIAPRRALLADQYRSALAALAEQAERDGALLDAFQYYHWLTAADPLDEAGHRGLMRAYLRSGHASAAIQQFERLATLLRSELDIEPSPETSVLVEAARRRTADDHPLSRPFVGRRRERAAILERVEAASRGQLAIVFLEGDPGIGKSRLLDVLADDARWRGFAVAAARGDDSRPGAPYAPLDEALAEVITPAAFDRQRRALPAAAIDAAATLLPQLVERSSAQVATDRPNLAAGLTALVRAFTAERPLLLILDDVHLAGPAFWDSLGFLEQVGNDRLCVVLAFRSRDVRVVDFAWEALRRLDASLVPLRLRLAGLSSDESVELADALGVPIDNEELGDVQRLTAGNPLLLQQVFATAPGARRQESGFVGLLDRRLAALGPAARRALDAAAVLGPSFSFADWLASVPDEPPAALDEVVASRLVVELSDSYGLEHDLTRHHVYDSMEPVRRAELHRRVAQVLHRERAAPAVLARHHELGEQLGEAVLQYRRAADEALARYAYREALGHVERALALELEHGPDRLPLLTLRHRLLGLLLDIDNWRTAVAVAEEAARADGDRLALLEALEGRLSLHVLDGDLAAMEEVGRQAVALSFELGDEQAEARLLSTLGWHLSESLGDNRRAVPMLRRAARLASETGDDLTRIAALCTLSSAQRSMGRCKAAHISATRTMAIVATRPRLYRARAHALAELAETALELGRWQEARDAMRGAVEAYREIDDPWSYGSALFGLVNICGGMGQGAEAIAAGEELVRLSVDVGLAPTSDYGVWHRVSLGRAHLAAGNLEHARQVVAEVTRALPEAVRPRIALRVLLGQLALAQGDGEAAVEPLAAAFEDWRQRAEPRDAVSPLWLAIAAAQAGHLEQARTALDTGEAALATTDMERFDILAAIARHEVTGEGAALNDARAAVARQADRFTDAALRAAFERAPLQREVERRWQSRPVEAGQVVVKLARADVPLGRPVRDDELVEVAWTVDDLAQTDSGSDGDSRRRRLIRLLEEARAAGAAPTDVQLAAALGVSRRTILRDAKLLGAERRTLPTRRRRS